MGLHLIRSDRRRSTLRHFVFPILRFPQLEVGTKLLQFRDLFIATSAFPRALALGLCALLLRRVPVPGLAGLAAFPGLAVVLPVVLAVVLPVLLGLALGRRGARRLRSTRPARPAHMAVAVGGLAVATDHLTVAALARRPRVARVGPHVRVVATVWASTTRHWRPLTSALHAIHLVLPLR